MDMKQEQVVNGEEEKQILPKRKMFSSTDPEVIAYREKYDKELRFKKKWEWSDEDLLMSLDDYNFNGVSKEECLKELPKYRKYTQQRLESGGFDVDDTPSIGLVGSGIHPLLWSEKRLQKYSDLAEFALESFNAENDKTNYQFLKVLKVNVSPSRWHIFFITFTAKDVSPRGRYRSARTFQAKVAVAVYQPEIPAEVKLCRIKPRY